MLGIINVVSLNAHRAGFKQAVSLLEFCLTAWKIFCTNDKHQTFEIVINYQFIC